MTTEEMKKYIAGGQWTSIAPELRPGAQKNPDGSTKPLFLTRNFRYFDGDKFTLTVTSLADAYGKIPLAQMDIGGHMFWKGPHPIAEGAQQVDFVADENYTVTPLNQGFADVLNKIAVNGYETWQVNETQNILSKSFAPFGLADGQIFSECDLIYIFHDLMFWGARHVDGRGFDTEANRPTNLQIPLVRV
jgi:hypothetical protein